MKFLNTRTRKCNLLLFIMAITFNTGYAQWTQIFSCPPASSATNLQFANDSVGYAQFTETLYKTSDRGASWNMIDVLGNPVSRPGISFVDANTGYLAYTEASDSAFLKKTTDGGTTWSAPVFLNWPFTYDIQFVDALTGYCIMFPNVKKTTDGGITWFPVLGSGGYRSLKFINASTGFVSSNTGIMRTTDGGATWTACTTPAMSAIQSFAFTSPTTCFAADASGILKTSDGGLNWVRKHNNPTRRIAFSDSTTGYAIVDTSGNSIFLTRDAGETWHLSATAAAYATDICFADPSTAYYATSSEIYKNTTVDCPFPNVSPNIYYNVAYDTLQLHVLPSYPGSYTYAWSPAAYFEDANVQNPIFISPEYADTATVTVTMYNSIPGCSTASNSLTIYTIKAFAGNDTIICAKPYNSYQLNAGMSMQDSTFTSYEWSPATGLSNPHIKNPFVNNVFQQAYVLHVYTYHPLYLDLYDTVLITSHNFITDSGYVCPGGAPVTLGIPDFAPVAGGYLWSTMDSTALIHVNTAGTYYQNCPYIDGCFVMNQFTLTDSCTASNVWPGDTNDDLITNNVDVLNIGLAYNETGPSRPAPDTWAWSAQPMTDWSSYFIDGINYKHADCDGNGIINTGDDTVIFYNYNYTHPPLLAQQSSQSRSTADLYLVADQDTVGLMATVNFAVMLGTTDVPIDSIYGIAYSISYDAELTYQPVIVNYNTSWFGDPATNTFSFTKSFHSDGYIDLAVSHMDHTNAAGSGQIGNAIIVTTDNLSGVYDVLHVDIYDVMAVTRSGAVINLTTAGDSVVIHSPTFGIHEQELAAAIRIYPNPGNGIINVSSTYKNVEEITVYNTLGVIVHTEQKPGMNTQLDLSAVENGIYIVAVKTDRGIVNKRITISR